MQSEIQRNKFGLKQVSENGKYRIKELVEKNKHELEHMHNNLESQKQKVKMLEHELGQLNQAHSE